MVSLAIGLVIMACGGDDTGSSVTASPPTSGGATGTATVGELTDDDLHGTIVYISDISGSPDIWVMDADGSDVRQLTDTPSLNEAFPKWSPDGERIAYQGGTNLFVMNEDGSDARMVASSASAPTWSPDGTQLAFGQLAGNDVNLAIVDLGSNEVRTVLQAPGTIHGYPAWSPDGAKIAFFRSSSTEIGIFIANPDGGDLQLVTTDASLDLYPDWSPDGTRLVYAYPENNVEDIVVLTLADGGRNQLTTPETNNSLPSWSPDGCCIAFVTTRFERQAEIAVMRADGSGIHRLTQSPAGDGVPGLDWKP